MSSKNDFFKPTQINKEFMILDLIEKNSNITQREIASSIGVAVSIVNSFLDDYSLKGKIKKIYHTTKKIEYFVTKKGKKRRKLLNISFLKSSHEIYLSAKENIIMFLDQINKKGFNKILLYGAGDVAEIMLNVIATNRESIINIIAVIDDDPKKQNQKLINTPIIPLVESEKYDYDGILISSYKNNEIIFRNLISNNYETDKIIQFFD